MYNLENKSFSRKDKKALFMNIPTPFFFLSRDGQKRKKILFNRLVNMNMTKVNKVPQGKQKYPEVKNTLHIMQRKKAAYCTLYYRFSYLVQKNVPQY